MEKNKFIVYYLSSSDKPDEIRGIGYTGRKLEERVKEHIRESNYRNSIGKKTHKENWIQKCIRLNIKISIVILEDNIDEKYIENKEIHYINYYKSLGHSLVNATGGGDGQKHMSEETKQKISNFRKGHKSSPETIEKLRQAGYKRKHTYIEKEKMSRAISGTNAGKKQSVETINHLKVISKSKKAVFQYTMNNVFISEFSSIKEAMNLTGVHKNSITNCCKGNKYSSAGGFIWKFKNEQDNVYTPSEKTKLKPVLQYTFDNVFVNEYKSIGEASKLTNGHRGHISECCKGKVRSSGGFIWKYKDQ